MTARPSTNKLRAPLVTGLAALVLALAGCSTEAQIREEVEQENSLPSAEESLDPVDAAPEPAGPVEVTLEPFELVVDGSATSCRASEYPRLVTYDVSFKANVGLDEVELSLDGDGVSTAGAIQVVPPVNFGGRIDLSGSAQPGRGNVLAGAPGIDEEGREPAVLKSYLPGETGLYVWPIQVDATADEPATIDSFSATYTTTTGRVGTVETPADLTYLVSDDCDAALG